MVRTGRAREQPCLSPSCTHTWLPCSERAWDPLCLLVWFQRTKQERAPGTACCPQVSCVSLTALACRLLSPPPLPAPPPTPIHHRGGQGSIYAAKGSLLGEGVKKEEAKMGAGHEKTGVGPEGNFNRSAGRPSEAQGGPGLGTVYELLLSILPGCIQYSVHPASVLPPFSLCWPLLVPRGSFHPSLTYQLALQHPFSSKYSTTPQNPTFTKSRQLHRGH